MHVLLVNNSPIPVFAYGGTERVIWDLGRCLVGMGHKVSYLVAAGSSCEFAQVHTIDPQKHWAQQIPAGVDIAHFQFNPHLPDENALPCPFVVTEHGNARKFKPLPRNTVFVSRNHASRYGSTAFVLNGLDWSACGGVDFGRPRPRFHFLGKAAWRVKNVKGAIRVAKLAGVDIDILGGWRTSFKRDWRITLTRRAHFHGMVGGRQKFDLLNGSRGMIFPTRWHEPFGLAVIESMYFGCPVFATPYGALPELVPGFCGVLADNAPALADAIRSRSFDARAIHQHVVQHFNAQRMTQDYLHVYERVLAGEALNARPPVIQDPSRSLPWRNH